MPELVFDVPAICDSCRTVFPSGLAVADSGQLGIHSGVGGLKAGPCSNCGEWGTVPDGNYAIVGNALATSPDYMTREDMMRAAQILQDALRASPTPAIGPIEQALREQAPTAADYVMTLLRDPMWQGLGAIASIIACIVSVLTVVGMRQEQQEQQTPSVHSPSLTPHPAPRSPGHPTGR